MLKSFLAGVFICVLVGMLLDSLLIETGIRKVECSIRPPLADPTN